MLEVCIAATASATILRQPSLPDPMRGLTLLAAGVAPGLQGQVHRLVTRTENTIARFAIVVGHAAVTWLWLLASAVAFLFVAAAASAADVRMLDLRRHSVEDAVRDWVLGIRTFFRILRDQRTPYVARSVLAVALIYWLLPVAVAGEQMPVLEVLDDVAVAIIGAKLALYLCPDSLIAANARTVRTRA
jgi:uncharacterized membrane protein YkvA (DUF1232 family)